MSCDIINHSLLDLVCLSMRRIKEPRISSFYCQTLHVVESGPHQAQVLPIPETETRGKPKEMDIYREGRLKLGFIATS